MTEGLFLADLSVGRIAYIVFFFSYTFSGYTSKTSYIGSVSTRFGFLIETKCVPMILLSEREQFGHRTYGLA